MTSPSVESLLQEHAPMVRRLALRLSARLPSNVELDDLIQAGMMGLLDAARRYKEQVGAKFTSYAIVRINGSMIDELRSQDWLPRSTRLAARRLEEAVKLAGHNLGRAPTEQEIADAMGVPLEEYYKLLDAAHGIDIVHYDALIPEEDIGTGETTFEPLEQMASDKLDPSLMLEAEDFKATLAQVIDKLPEREKLVLSLLYEQEMNLAEVGEVLKLTAGRICQLRTQAMGRIRAALSRAHWDKAPASMVSED